MKVLFTYDYGKEALQAVRELGFDAEFFDEKLIADYQDYESVEVLICYNPFKYIDLRKFKRLKYILLSSIGFDQLPKKSVKDMNITVCNNKGGYSIPMGEWIVMKVLEMVKHSKSMYQSQEKKTWHMDTHITELYEKKILFFGTGTIAQEAAKRLQGFDMEVIGLNTNGRDMPYFDRCEPIDQAKSLVKTVDAVVIALPSTEKTKGLFSKDLIDALPSHAILVNIARGDIIDENYLVEALKNKRFKAAALDVFLQEPLADDHPFWSMENVIVTCHNSWISEKRNQRRYEIIYKNLVRLKNRETLLNQIDIQKGY